MRARALRISRAPGETLEAWSRANITTGGEELRYLKFLLRAEAEGAPLGIDDEECAFVAASLRKALHTNADALRGFWLGCKRLRRPNAGPMSP